MLRQKRRELERQIAEAEHHILITVKGGGRLIEVDYSMASIQALQVLAHGAQKIRLEAQTEIQEQAQAQQRGEGLIKPGTAYRSRKNDA